MTNQTILSAFIEEQQTGGGAAAAVASTNSKKSATKSQGTPGLKKQVEADIYKRLVGLMTKIKIKHPSLIWRFDNGGKPNSDINDRSLFSSLNRATRGWPDLMIIYKGRIMFLEIKTTIATPAKLLNPKDQHGVEQLTIINELRENNLQAGFAIGYEMAYKKIFAFIDGREVTIL